MKNERDIWMTNMTVGLFPSKAFLDVKKRENLPSDRHHVITLMFVSLVLNVLHRLHLDSLLSCLEFPHLIFIHFLVRLLFLMPFVVCNYPAIGLYLTFLV